MFLQKDQPSFHVFPGGFVVIGTLEYSVHPMNRWVPGYITSERLSVNGAIGQSSEPLKLLLDVAWAGCR